MLEAVPVEDRAKVAKDLELNSDSVIQKTLKMQWNVPKVQLKFDVGKVNRKPT